MPQLSEELNPLEEQGQELGVDTDTELASDKHLSIDQFTTILERILPLISHDDEKIISAQVILGLRLEGILGTEITPENSHMIEIIKESIMSSDEKRESAILLAKRIIDKLDR